MCKMCLVHLFLGVMVLEQFSHLVNDMRGRNQYDRKMDMWSSELVELTNTHCIIVLCSLDFLCLFPLKVDIILLYFPDLFHPPNVGSYMSNDILLVLFSDLFLFRTL